MKVSGGMILREIAGEFILIPVGQTALKVHGMITLTESGQMIYNKLKDDCTEEDLVDTILAEYDIDRETAEKDVKAFLEKLDELGLLQR